MRKFDLDNIRVEKVALTFTITKEDAYQMKTPLNQKVSLIFAVVLAMSCGQSVAQNDDTRIRDVQYRDGEQEINIENISKELRNYDYLSYRYGGVDSMSSNDRLEIERSLEDNDILQPVLYSTELGGTVAGAAEIILTMAAIADRKCKEIGENYELEGKIGLVKSEINAIYHARLESEPWKIGRGQFSIESSKTFVCFDNIRNVRKNSSAIVEWVFNVNGNGLVYKRGGAKNNYSVMLSAGDDGTRNIQVVSLKIDEYVVPNDHSVYKISDESCIEIFFKVDISVPVGRMNSSSTSYDPVFCAGGRCKKRPPYLDATM